MKTDNRIKCIYFDLWKTLIRGNSFAFVARRAVLSSKKYNKKKLAPEEVDRLYNEFKIKADRLMELTGYGLNTDHLYYLFLCEICPENEIDTLMIDDLINDMQSVSLLFPPEVYSSQTLDILSKLGEDGYCIRLISNTNFILGETLRTILRKMGMLQYFNEYYFSDEGVPHLAKPNPKLYEHVISPFPPEACVMVGDNRICDIDGANAIGMNAYLINSNTKTIVDFYEDLSNGKIG